MESMRQLGLLLLKNGILRRRHWFLTLLEIFIPLLVASLLIYIRIQFQAPSWKNATIYDEGGLQRPIVPQMLAFTPNSALAKELALRIQNESSSSIQSKLNSYLTISFELPFSFVVVFKLHWI